MSSEHIEFLAVPIFPEILSELILLDTAGEIMDENEFKERASRLEKIAKVVEKLPNEIRAAAFDLIKGYVTEHAPGGGAKKYAQPQEPADEDDDAAFFAKFAHDKPSDNAKLIAANHYRKYGLEPFSVDEVNHWAKEVGVTVPARVDMTFEVAKDKGKNLFVRAGMGKFKPTVHGEQFLKATYSIKKGIQSKPATTAE